MSRPACASTMQRRRCASCSDSYLLEGRRSVARHALSVCPKLAQPFRADFKSREVANSVRRRAAHRAHARPVVGIHRRDGLIPQPRQADTPMCSIRQLRPRSFCHRDDGCPFHPHECECRYSTLGDTASAPGGSCQRVSSWRLRHSSASWGCAPRELPKLSIGVLAALSCPRMEPSGVATREAAELAVSEINARGRPSTVRDRARVPPATPSVVDVDWTVEGAATSPSERLYVAVLPPRASSIVDVRLFPEHLCLERFSVQ